MHSGLKLLFVTFVSCAIGGGAWAAATPPWPQDGSDLRPDPSVIFGVLPNGMRYALKHNSTPAGQASLRLRIGSGSLEESDAEQGLAHVLEHMSFKGSTHVPAGEMIKILQRKGLAFGPDTNAETEWSQTVYMLDLPRSDNDMLQTGLLLMRETAGELTLDDKALTPERGVVLSEERLRDTPDYRAEKAAIEVMLPGQLAAQRFPIGKVDVIEHAPIALVRAFYQANYRPDRATLIAVGDFDPKAMEARIKARFSDWRPSAPAPAEVDPGAVAARGPTAKVIEVPGSSTRASITWMQPFDGSADSAEKRRRETLQALALAVLNRRLDVLAHSEHPPFLGAHAGYENLLHSAKVAQVEALSSPDAWRPALAAIELEERRLTAFGVGDAELAREIVEMRAALKNAVVGAETRNTPTVASDLVESVDARDVFTDPAADLAIFEADVKGLTTAEVDAAARQIFKGQGPVVELATPTAVEGGDAALAAEFARLQSAPVDAETAQASVAWPYTSFGPPGAVLKRTEMPEFGAVAVRFANGVGLIVKPTKFEQGQILVTARIGGGRLSLSRQDAGAIWTAGAFIGGGLSAISYEDAQRALAGKIYAAEFDVDDDAFVLKGATQPRDLSTQMQVLAAYLAHPGYRAEAFQRLRAAYLAALPRLEATPDGVLSRDLDGLLHAGDPRWAFPGVDALDAAQPGEVKALLGPALSKGSIELTIVGDVAVDDAIAQVAATFGALAPRSAVWDTKPQDEPVSFPTPTTTPLTRADTGRPDQAMAVVAWPTTDFFADMKQSRAAMVAGEVLQNRILEQVRIAEGATYSPEGEVALSEEIPDYGLAISQVEMPPPKIPGFFATVTKLTADLRQNGLTDDELARARNPRVAGIEKARLTNDYWLERLSGAMADPRRLDLIRTTLPDYQSMTKADVQAAARVVFQDDKAWRLVVSSEK